MYRRRLRMPEADALWGAALRAYPYSVGEYIRLLPVFHSLGSFLGRHALNVHIHIGIGFLKGRGPGAQIGDAAGCSRLKRDDMPYGDLSLEAPSRPLRPQGIHGFVYSPGYGGWRCQQKGHNTQIDNDTKQNPPPQHIPPRLFPCLPRRPLRKNAGACALLYVWRPAEIYVGRAFPAQLKEAPSGASLLRKTICCSDL